MKAEELPEVRGVEDAEEVISFDTINFIAKATDKKMAQILQHVKSCYSHKKRFWSRNKE
jgi:hypothetical protein